MSTLTKQERDGLEEVFLSIQSRNQKFEKIGTLSLLLLKKIVKLSFKKIYPKARSEQKALKITHLLFKTEKKKKNLSK